MGYMISRQRDYESDTLFVEVAVGGPAKAGKDILTIRYENNCEGKNLVDPRDAIRCAEDIFKKWDRDYGDEKKRLRIVGLETPLIFDFTTKGIAAAKIWADRIYGSMEKCGYCNKPMGNRKPFTIDDIPTKVFESELCLANEYRRIYGTEAPNISAKRKIKI